MKKYVLENWKELGLFQQATITETEKDFVILRYPLTMFGMDQIYPKNVKAAKTFMSNEVYTKKGVRAKWVEVK